MNTCVRESQRYEFSFPSIDTVVEVETSAAGVIIHASRDTFSETRRASFLRMLAAEGFIRDEFYWRSPDSVRWIVDSSWFMPDAACAAQTRRCMQRLIFSTMALWLLLLSCLVLQPGRARSNPPVSGGGHSQASTGRPAGE